ETLDDSDHSPGRTERPLSSTNSESVAASIAPEDNDNDANFDGSGRSSRSRRGSGIGRRLRRAGDQGQEIEGGVLEGAPGETDAGEGGEPCRAVVKLGDSYGSRSG
ncbi:unnamed protein product, partial [Pylaiella littoralis]